VTRLAKASGTYAGGIDYIAWKINRHAGTDFQITPWQRRWPLLGAITLLPRLLKRGGDPLTRRRAVATALAKADTVKGFLSRVVVGQRLGPRPLRRRSR
jgi:hypothetical protein